MVYSRLRCITSNADVLYKIKGGGLTNVYVKVGQTWASPSVNVRNYEQERSLPFLCNIASRRGSFAGYILSDILQLALMSHSLGWFIIKWHLSRYLNEKNGLVKVFFRCSYAIFGLSCSFDGVKTENRIYVYKKRFKTSRAKNTQKSGHSCI